VLVAHLQVLCTWVCRHGENECLCKQTLHTKDVLLHLPASLMNWRARR
jgi:hypothetical protein